MKKSTVKIYEKLLKKDKDYDYAFLLELEQFKLKRMVKNFENASCPHVGIEYNIRDMKNCIALIDIILEKDAPYNTYLDTYYGANGKIKMSVCEDHTLKIDREPDCYKTPVHVNTTNYKRFKFKTEPDDILKMDYRRVKAMYLYNRIRTRMFDWWW